MIEMQNKQCNEFNFLERFSVAASRKGILDRKCRGSKTPYPGSPSASYKDVWGQYAWVVAPARTSDRCSLQSGVHNPASNDLPRFHSFGHSNRQLFTWLRLTSWPRIPFRRWINCTSPDGTSMNIISLFSVTLIC